MAMMVGKVGKMGILVLLISLVAILLGMSQSPPMKTPNATIVTEMKTRAAPKLSLIAVDPGRHASVVKKIRHMTRNKINGVVNAENTKDNAIAHIRPIPHLS